MQTCFGNDHLSTEDDFKQISLNAFLNSEDDADVDWEDYFALPKLNSQRTIIESSF